MNNILDLVPQTSEMNWLMIFFIIFMFSFYSFSISFYVNSFFKFNMSKDSLFNLSFFSLF